MGGQTETRGLAAESADVIAELYPTLWEFAAVVAGSSAAADDVIVDTLSWMIPIRSLGDLDEPGVEVRRLMVERHSGWGGGGRRGRNPRQPMRTRAAIHLDAVEGRDAATVARIIGRDADHTRRLIARTTRRSLRRRSIGTRPHDQRVRSHVPTVGPAGVDALIRRLDARLSASARPVTADSHRPGGGMRRGVRVRRLAAAFGVVAVTAFAMIASGVLPDDAPSAPRDDDFDPMALAAVDEARPPITLVPAPRNESVQMATSIGALEFATLAYSPVDWYSGMVTTPHGAVAAPGLRWSDDYRTWEDVAVGQPLVVAAGDDIITYGSTDPDGNGMGLRLTWNGSGWTESAKLELPGPVDQIVVGPNGTVGIDQAQRRFTGERWEYTPQLVIYTSSDGVRFTTATQPPTALDAGETPTRRAFRPVRSPARFGSFAGGCAPGRWSTDGDSIYSTEDGFLAFIAAQPGDWGITPICEPQVWFSPDGDVWNQVGGSAPFGVSAAISAVAHHAGRFAAIGTVSSDAPGETESALWASADGATWERVDVELPRVTALGAGEMGWVVVGFDRRGGDIGLWVSPDAFTWDGPYDLSPVLGPARKPRQIVAGPDEIVILAERGITIGRLDGSFGS